MQTNVLILTDDSEFAQLLCAAWRNERRCPSITAVTSPVWAPPDSNHYDLLIIGPVSDDPVKRVLASLPPTLAVILCAPSHSCEGPLSRAYGPQVLHVPLREDWTQTLLPLAEESLRRVAYGRQLRQALSRAAKNECEAILGRYMLEMKHSVNNALTSILGNAELLLLEPGQLNAQSLQQIKTVHQMSLRLNEIMQRFSTLASEIRDAETASQPETSDSPEIVPSGH